MSHTKGPWHSADFVTATSRHQVLGGNRLIASIWQHFDRNNKQGELRIDEANTRLITAAPDLLEAAKHAAMEWQLHGQLTDSYRGLVAAIDKAEGREGK